MAYTYQHQTCDRCGASWQIAWKCQIICPNCGARQDCSDLFIDHEQVQNIRALVANLHQRDQDDG